ncbi:hypothetical protein Golax_001501 [Gossypium laxum]|uniref:Uncharacterized protein n=2 Tax=Gossypium TaxID=3633 RepID=A0A7J8YLV9_GOSAI|nr:hypothetical protein [Gossypium aridum]MBA0728614.1 hypothetical protein [Gossypium laxum]
MGELEPPPQFIPLLFSNT